MTPTATLPMVTVGPSGTVLFMNEPFRRLVGGRIKAIDRVFHDLPVRSGDWSPAEVAKGREQLIAAIDAAWIRIIASGRDQKVLDTEPTSDPGASHSYIVRLVDCLPQPEIAPWPEKPVGMFKDILDTGAH